MSKLLRAWYTFLALGLLTFIATAFIGQIPYALTSVVASPIELFSRSGTNLRGTLQSMTDRRDTRAENLALTSKVNRLETEKRQLELELSRLELLLSVRQNQSPGARLTAPVTGLSPGAVIKELSLGRGSNHGVKADMPVTTEAGLVGLVTNVTPRQSRVRAITDPQSRVGVTVTPGETTAGGGQGIAVGIPGGLLRVTNFIEETPVRRGDRVETSSRGGLFPRGITVGEVVRNPVRNPNDLRVEFVVRPAVDTQTLLEVALIEPQ